MNLPKKWVVALSTLFACALAVQDSNAQQISVKGFVSAKTGMIRLGDLAEVYAKDSRKKQLLESLPLLTFSGREKIVTRNELAQLLKSNGLDLIYWKLTGSNQTRITNAQQLTGTVNRMSTMRLPGNNALNQMQTTHRRDTTQWNNSNTRFHSTGRQPWARPAGIGSGSYHLSPTEQRSRRSFANKQGQKTRLVWAAVAMIPAGELITSSMLKAKEVTGREGTYFQDASGLLGKVAKHRLASGQAIRRTSVREPYVIRKGDVIKLVSRVGRLEVSRKVTAAQNGSMGQVIKTQSADRKKIFFGKVRDANSAEIVQGSARDQKNPRRTRY